MTMHLIPTDKPVGAEIRGVDLSKPVDDELFARIRAALDAHSVVFFRDQQIDEAAHVAFSRRMGPLRVPRLNSDALVPGWPDLTVLSNIIENGKPIGLLEAGQYWHTDNCFRAEPNGYAVLYAQEIPQRDGKALGGTMFTSTVHACATLPDAQRRELEGLKARHNFKNPFRHEKLSPAAERLYWEEACEPDVLHPVIRTHPRTRRQCLYVNETYTVGIDGLPEKESRALIEALCAHIKRPEFIYTHDWRPGDFLIWDDCAVQHHAVADYGLPLRRRLRRTTVRGSVPF